MEFYQKHLSPALGIIYYVSGKYVIKKCKLFQKPKLLFPLVRFQTVSNDTLRMNMNLFQMDKPPLKQYCFIRTKKKLLIGIHRHNDLRIICKWPLYLCSFFCTIIRRCIHTKKICTLHGPHVYMQIWCNFNRPET